MPSIDPNYELYTRSLGYNQPTNNGVDRVFFPTANYIYLYHTGVGIVLPTWPDNMSDTTSVVFSQSVPLGRSAPIYSYSNSGPRSVMF